MHLQPLLSPLAEAPVSHGRTPTSTSTPPVYRSAKNGGLAFRPADDLVVLLMNQLEADHRVHRYDLIGGCECEATTTCGRIRFIPLPHGGFGRQDAFDAKFAAKTERGDRVLLVAEARLRARPLMQNAALIASSGAVCPTPLDRVRLLDQLKAEGGCSTLGDLAACARNSGDPVRAVLSLVAAGLLWIELDRPIDADSLMARAEDFHV